MLTPPGADVAVTLGAQLGAERFQISLETEAGVVGPPTRYGWKSPRMAGWAGQGSGLHLASAADKDRHPAEIDEDLRGTAGSGYASAARSPAAARTSAGSVAEAIGTSWFTGSVACRL